MYQVRTLENEKFINIVTCLNEAFSDYEISISLSEDVLRYRFEEANVMMSLSVGAYCEDKLVGFIINAVADIENEHTAYDLSTGILSDHRSQGLMKMLVDFTKELLVKIKVTHYLLEVLQLNERAIRAYTKQGFKIAREYLCYQGTEQLEVKNYEVKQKPLTMTQLKKLEQFEKSSSAFENNYHTIELALEDHALVYYEKNSKLVGFIIINTKTRKVKQAGGLIDCYRDLIIFVNNNYPQVKFNNINRNQEYLNDLLFELGLLNFTNQYQMELSIEPNK